jgi:hypothetical protein
MRSSYFKISVCLFLALVACDSFDIRRAESDAIEAGLPKEAGLEADTVVEAKTPRDTVTYPSVLEEEASPNSTDSVRGGDVVSAVPTEEERNAISNCEKGWGEKFPGSLDSIRKISAKTAKNDSGSIVDEKETGSPELTLIVASDLSETRLKWRLLNPQGWYCVIASEDTLQALSIVANKNTRIGDSLGSPTLAVKRKD